MRRQRVAVHEAGHFLVAYLTGLLPVAYTLSSLDAFNRYRALNMQAGCRFADAAFSQQVAAGKLKASSLQRFACVALAGVCSESEKLGKAEGGTSDILQLDGMLRALQVRLLQRRDLIRSKQLQVPDNLTTHAHSQHSLTARARHGHIIPGLESSSRRPYNISFTCALCCVLHQHLTTRGFDDTVIDSPR